MAYSDLSNRTEKMLLSDDTTIREVTDLEGLPATAAETDATKTTIPKMGWLKGLVKILADVWNSTAHSLKVQVTGSSLTYANRLPAYLVNSSGLEALISNTLGDSMGGATTLLATASVQYGSTGNTRDQIRVANVKKYVSSASIAAGGTLTVWTPTTGKKFRLLYIAIFSSVAGKMDLQDGGSTFHIFGIPSANGSKEINYPQNGVLSSAVNNALAVLNDTGSGASIKVFALGTEE